MKNKLIGKLNETFLFTSRWVINDEWVGEGIFILNKVEVFSRRKE